MGELAEDPVTGKIKKISGETKWQRRRKTYCSAAIITFFIALVIVFVLSIFLYRATMKDDEWGPRLCAFANAIQIKIMNYVYGHVAKWLTKWENHEIDSHYHDALATKLFLF